MTNRGSGGRDDTLKRVAARDEAGSSSIQAGTRSEEQLRNRMRPRGIRTNLPSHPVAPLGADRARSRRRVKTARAIILPTRFRNIRARGFMRMLNLCITHIRAKVYARRQVISPASCSLEFVMPPGQSVDLSLRFPPLLSLSQHWLLFSNRCVRLERTRSGNRVLFSCLYIIRFTR